MVTEIGIRSGGIEITTKTCGISGRIWLDLDEAVVVRDWLNRNLANEIKRQQALSEQDRQDEIRRLQNRLSHLIDAAPTT